MTEAGVTRVVCVGLGAIGAAALRRCLASDQFVVAGAVDPRRVGERWDGIEVVGALDDLAAAEADVALVATGSGLEHVVETIATALGLGLHVVSTCEQLAYPWKQHPQLSATLDHRARHAARTVVGCGVNPGFVMDVMPALLASACLYPKSVVVTRRADLGRRRPQLRDKLGVGRPLEDWVDEADERQYGHTGLVESACLCALGIGREVVEDVAFKRDPIADGDGQVVGIREVADLEARDGCRVHLELEFEIGGIDDDRIEIDGSPALRMVVEGGIQGDDATVARMLRSASIAPRLRPGLRLPLEVPAFASD